jgi:hypothetical protein
VVPCKLADFELPDALQIFARGREDRDVPLVLDR